MSGSEVKEALKNGLKNKLSNLIEVSAERAMLSTILTDHKRFDEAISILNREHFGNKVCRRIFEIIVWISKNRNNGKPVTPEQILYEEKFSATIKEINGDKFINALRDVPYNSDSFEKIKQILLATRAKRERYSELCVSLERIVDYDGYDIEEILSIGMDEQLNSIQNAANDNSNFITKLGDGLPEYVQERMENPQEVIGPPLKSYPIFNSYVQLKPGQLIVTAARQKIGKSTLQLSFAKDLSVDQNLPTGLVDSEMLIREQQLRILANASSVEIDKIEKGLIAKDKGDFEAVERSLKRISETPLYMKRIPVFSTLNIISSIKLMHIMYGIQVAFFDQIKDTVDKVSSNADKEHQRVGWLTFALKSLAEELMIPIHANIQFKRGGSAKAITSGEVEPDELIADSDRVGRFANVCCFIRDKTDEEIRRDGGIIRGGNRVLNVFLNRGGDTHHQFGGINYLLRGVYSRFEEIGLIDDF